MSRKMRKEKRVKKDKFMEVEQKRPPLTPKTPNQATYIEAIKRFTQTISLGCAGTGKTYIAATMAAQMYARGEIDKIILTRPNVPL